MFPSVSEAVFKNRFLVSVLMRRICCFGRNLSLNDNEIRILNFFHVSNIKQNMESGMCFTEREFIHIKFREIDCTAFLHVLAKNPLNNRSLEWKTWLKFRRPSRTYCSIENSVWKILLQIPSRRLQGPVEGETRRLLKLAVDTWDAPTSHWLNPQPTSLCLTYARSDFYAADWVS